MRKILIISAFGIQLAAQAVLAQKYQIVPNANTTGVTIVVPYDLGTHHGEASQITGGVLVSNNFSVITGGFIVPIDAISTGNPTRDCHMRESLGLDYSKSQFPKKHICDAKNQLPQGGVDAVVFQNIEFKLAGVTGEIASQIKPGNSFAFTANGSWSVHGIEKSISFPLKILVLENGVLNIKGSVPFSLTDYGIIVKPLLGIGVKNKMTAEINILLAPQR